MTTPRINTSDMISAMSGMQMQAQNEVVASLGKTVFSTSFQSILESSSSGSSGQNTSSVKKTDLSQTVGTTESQTTNSKIKDAVNNSQLNKDTSKTDGVDKDAVKSVIAEITDTVKEKLNLTDEELADVLTKLGMTVQELVLPQNVAKVIAEVNNTDVTSIVTDNTMTNLLADVTTEIADTVQNSAMTAEEIAAFTEFADAENIEFAVDTEIEQNVENPETEDMPKQSDVKEILTSSVEDDGENVKVVENTTVETETVDVFKETQNSFTDSKDAGTKQNGSENTAQNILNGLTESIQNSIATDGSFEQLTGTGSTFAADIIEQMIAAVKVNVTADTQSMEIQLTPENLGKVNLNVVLKEGIITATITAQNEAVKNVIDSQLVQLRENLNNQGLKVDAVEVTVENQAFDTNAQNDDSNGKRTDRGHGKRIFRGIDELPEEELTVDISEQSILNINGSSVSYTA